jgi:hypothetical protein
MQGPAWFACEAAGFIENLKIQLERINVLVTLLKIKFDRRDFQVVMKKNRNS